MADLYRTVDLSTLSFTTRNNDGSGNNTHGGQVLDTYDRATAPSYPAGSDGSLWDAPTVNGPRDISDQVMSTDADIPNGFGINELFQFFGQVLTHDVASAQASGNPADAVIFTGGGGFAPLTRDTFQLVDGVRAPIDVQTSFFDLSQVYGPSDALANLLRDPGSGRLLTSSGDMLPLFADLTAAHPSDDVTGILGANGFFTTAGYLAGDPRVNQQAGLTSLQTLFMRNHNYNADKLADLHPDWSDDRVYETARAINEAQWQHVVYDEYVTKLVGTQALSKYHGFKANVDPSIINEWTTVAFRFGHDQASNDTDLLNENGSVFRNVTLADNFRQGLGLDPAHPGPALGASDQTMGQWLRGEMAQYTQEIDGKVSNGVRNSLFGFAGVDLAAIDIVRGDDHGVGNYNVLREGLGLSTYTSFDQFAQRNGVDAATTAALKSVYGNDINKLDSEVGVLLEKHAKGSMMGETGTILNVMQFENLRDGDRFYFEQRFKGEPDLIAAIKNTSLADIIAHNTDIGYVYHDAFAAAARIGGDDNGNVLSGTGKGDLVLGFGGIDTLRGRGGDDDVWGGDGSDNIFGGNGNDRLYGEGGGDNLRGGAGRDFLSGGAGNDNLWGNGGRDTFHFVDGGTDHVKDFARNELIDLSDYAEFQKFADVRASMAKVGSSTVITLDDGLIVLDHFNINKLGAGNFVYSEIFDHIA